MRLDPARALSGAALVLALSSPSIALAQSAPASSVTAATVAPEPGPSPSELALRRTGRFFAYATLAAAVGTGVGSGSLAWRIQGADAPTLNSEIRGWAIGFGVATVALLASSVTLFALCPPEDPDPARGSRALPWGLYAATAVALVPAVAGLVYASTGASALGDPAQHPDRGTTTGLVAHVFYGESIAAGFFALAGALGVWSAASTAIALGPRDTPHYDVHFAALPSPGGAMFAVGGWL